MSVEDVAGIRRRAAQGEAAYSIAKDFPVSDTQIRNIIRGDQWVAPEGERPPAGSRAVLENLWVGTSVESQEYADRRIPDLVETPAAVRFLSIEPQLDTVSIRPWLWLFQGGHSGLRDSIPSGYIGWVIVGGESGPGARPFNIDWARALRDECAEAGVAFFMKQMGSLWAAQNGFKGKGNHPNEWPEEFPREYPTAFR